MGNHCCASEGSYNEFHTETLDLDSVTPTPLCGTSSVQSPTDHAPTPAQGSDLRNCPNDGVQPQRTDEVTSNPLHQRRLSENTDAVSHEQSPFPPVIGQRRRSSQSQAGAAQRFEGKRHSLEVPLRSGSKPKRLSLDSQRSVSRSSAQTAQCISSEFSSTFCGAEDSPRHSRRLSAAFVSTVQEAPWAQLSVSVRSHSPSVASYQATGASVIMVQVGETPTCATASWVGDSGSSSATEAVPGGFLHTQPLLFPRAWSAEFNSQTFGDSTAGRRDSDRSRSADPAPLALQRQSSNRCPLPKVRSGTASLLVSVPTTSPRANKAVETEAPCEDKGDSSEDSIEEVEMVDDATQLHFH